MGDLLDVACRRLAASRGRSTEGSGACIARTLCDAGDLLEVAYGMPASRNGRSIALHMTCSLDNRGYRWEALHSTLGRPPVPYKAGEL